MAAHELIWFRGSPIHGMGGFARCDLAPGTRVIEYVGERISKRESLRRCQTQNSFIFCLDDECDLDGQVGWNPARLINHSCGPNCEAECLEGRIWLVAQQAIRAGEEITFNYGYDLESYRENPCHCGSPACVGYMVDAVFFDHVRAQNLRREV